MRGSDAARSTAYHRQMSWTWWLKNPNYTRFMIREITSVFVALYLMSLLWFVARLPDGAAAMQAHFETLKSPAWVVFHVVALAFALYHTITWFNLTPKVMVVWRGEEKVPGWMLAGGNYVAWIVVSGVIAWVLHTLKGG